MPREFWKKTQIPSSRDERCLVIKVVTSACEQLLSRFPTSNFHGEKGQELGDTANEEVWLSKSPDDQLSHEFVTDSLVHCLVCIRQ